MGRKKRSGSSSAKKHRGWTTEAQHELLSSYLPRYMVAKAKPGQKGFDEFWPVVLSEWFKQWPLPELTQSQLDQGMTTEKQLEVQKLVGGACSHFKQLNLTHIIQRLTQWYNNHTRTSSSGEGKKKVLDLGGRKRKMLPDWQAYSRLYYDDRIKATVDREWQEEIRKQNENEGDGTTQNLLSKVANVRFRAVITQRLFANESPEIKENVEKYRKDLFEGKSKDEGADNVLDDKDAAEAAQVAQAKSYHE